MPQKTGRLLFLLIFTFLFSFVLVFSASALQRGDIDEDGAVTAADARTALRLSVGLIDPLPDAAATETDATETDATATDATATDATATDATETDATATDAATDTDGTGALPDEKKIARMRDIGDIDLDGELTAGDARQILRISVKLDPSLPYYATTVIQEPTCTEKGVVERISTDPSVTVDFQITQEIPALGHTTQLGICSRCGEYQDALLPEYREKIAAPLNLGVSALKQANALLKERHEADILEGTLTIGRAKNEFITAYNHFYGAYVACGDKEEFKEAKQLIYSICMQLLEVVYTGEITQENCNVVYTKWSADADAVLHADTGLLFQLKAITDGFRNPAGETATGTDAGTATETDAVTATDADARETTGTASDAVTAFGPGDETIRG